LALVDKVYITPQQELCMNLPQ
jgi:hypothetical protein